MAKSKVLRTKRPKGGLGFGTNSIKYNIKNTEKKKNRHNNFIRAAATLQKYNEIQQQVSQLSDATTKVNLKNSKYSKNAEYSFPYSLTSAKTILENCIHSENTFDLVKDNYFGDKLNIYLSYDNFEDANPERILNISEQLKFQNSDYAKCALSQLEYFDTLKISTWKYADVVASAIFFYLENIYSATSIEAQTNTTRQIFELKIASGRIAPVLLSPIFGSVVFENIKQTNFFTKFSYPWVYGFVSFLESKISQTHGKVKNCDKLFSMINYQFKGNYSGFYYYLAAFDFMIPDIIIQNYTAYCVENKSISIIYYCLKQYKNILNSSLSEKEKYRENYSLGIHFYEEFQHIDIFNSAKNNNAILSFLVFSILAFNYSFLTSDGTLLMVGVLPGLLSSKNFTKFSLAKLQVKTISAVGESASSLGDGFIPSTPSQKPGKNISRPSQRLQKKQIKARDPLEAWRGRCNQGDNKVKTTPDGLVYVSNSQLNTFHRVGVFGPYGRLGRDGKKLNKHFEKLQLDKKKSPFNQFKTEDDHINPERLRELVGLRKSKCIAVTVTRLMNQTKQSVGAGQFMPSWDQFDKMLTQDIIGFFQTESQNGMLDYLEKNEKDHLEVLQKIGLYPNLLDIYKDCKPQAISEMMIIAETFGLGNEINASTATFILPHIFLRMEQLSLTVERSTNYNEIGNKFHLEYVIEMVLQHMDELVRCAYTLKIFLQLGDDHPYNHHIDDEIKRCGLQLKIAANQGIAKYERFMQSCLLPHKTTSQLQSLRINVETELSKNYTNWDLLDASEVIFTDPIYLAHKIGDFATNTYHADFVQSNHKPKLFMQKSINDPTSVYTRFKNKVKTIQQGNEGINNCRYKSSENKDIVLVPEKLITGLTSQAPVAETISPDPEKSQQLDLETINSFKTLGNRKQLALLRAAARLPLPSSTKLMSDDENLKNMKVSENSAFEKQLPPLGSLNRSSSMPEPIPDDQNSLILNREILLRSSSVSELENLSAVQNMPYSATSGSDLPSLPAIPDTAEPALQMESPVPESGTMPPHSG